MGFKVNIGIGVVIAILRKWNKIVVLNFTIFLQIFQFLYAFIDSFANCIDGFVA